jgi:hypothetical protein
MTGKKPPARFRDLCIDAVDIEAAARFWSATLGLQINRPAGEIELVGPSAAHSIWINQVPEAKTVKNRVHLDVRVGDEGREAEVARLVTAGARELHRGAQGPYRWVTLADPEGNEFCLA